jgi:L-lactate dehydrogenase complex protein LldF
MKGRRRWTRALRLAPLIRFIRHGGPPPVSHWTSVRDLPEPPGESFRDWWVEQYGPANRQRRNGRRS